MTRDEVGSLHREVWEKMVRWLCSKGRTREQAEDIVADAFCYLLETQGRGGVPIISRYKRRSPEQVESLLWDRIRGGRTDQHREDTRRMEAQYTAVTGLNPSKIKPIASSNDVEENQAVNS